MMLNEPRIRLSPPEELMPRRSRIPTTRACRWRSPHEIAVEKSPGLVGAAAPSPVSEAAAVSVPAGEELPSARLQPAVSVFMTQRAYVRGCAHAGSDLKNEVGGALAGKRRVDTESGRTFIVIEAVIPARHTRQGSVMFWSNLKPDIDKGE